MLCRRTGDDDDDDDDDNKMMTMTMIIIRKTRQAGIDVVHKWSGRTGLLRMKLLLNLLLIEPRG